jgi:signal transduction histidine kinase/integral membrane sensor domain MASE1
VKSLKSSPILINILKFILIVIAYYFSARLGLKLATINQNVSPVWPPTGIAIGCLYLFGYRYLPAIAMGAFLANLSIGSPLSVVIPITIGNSLEAIAGIWIFKRIYQKEDMFGIHARTIAYILSSILSSIVSASIGVGTLCANGLVPLKIAGSVFLTWWTGDSMGGLVFAPLLIVYFGNTFKSLKAYSNYLPKFLLIVSCGAVLSWMIFYRPEGAPYLFFLFPFVLFCGHLEGKKGTTLASLLLTIFAVFSIELGTGVFHHGTTNANLVHLQLFLTSITISGLFIGDFKRVGLLKPPGLVLIVGWILSGALFASFYIQSNQKSDAEMLELISKVETAIQSKMDRNLTALQSSAGLFAVKNDVDHKAWKTFFNQLHLEVNLNGLLGIGIVSRIQKNQILKFNQMLIKEGVTGSQYYSLDKNSNLPEAYVIHLIEPYEKNKKALGLDLASEPIRKSAADLARDTGMPSLTDSIFLVQSQKKLAGFLIYYPLYTNGTIPQNITERRERLVGWAYAPVIMQDFFSAIFKTKDFEILSFSIVDPNSTSSQVFAESEDFKKQSQRAIYKHKIKIFNQTYNLKIARSAKFFSEEDTISSWVATFTALLSLLLSAFVVSSKLVEKKAKMAEAQTAIDLKINQDIVKEQQAKLVLSAKMSSLGEMAGGVAHEINNPLTIINSIATKMKKRIDSPEFDKEIFKEDLAKIENTVKRIAKIIKGLHSFSRNVEGDQKVSNKIATIVNDTLELCKERFKNHEIELKVNCPNDVYLECRPHQLAQVLMNLLGNAHDAVENIPEKWVAIDVQSHEFFVTISVLDSGKGIPQEVIDKIMQPFFTTKEVGKGTGLGLSISKGIIEDHHGSLRCDTYNGHTRFVIELPLKQPMTNVDSSSKNKAA